MANKTKDQRLLELLRSQHGKGILWYHVRVLNRHQYTAVRVGSRDRFAGFYVDHLDFTDPTSKVYDRYKYHILATIESLE